VISKNAKFEVAMPLTRLKDEYLVEDGVRFLMKVEDGSPVACRVSHEALRDHAGRVQLAGRDGEVFEAYRELIEDIASDVYDAGAPFNNDGRILVAEVELVPVMNADDLKEGIGAAMQAM
jgi:Protein of unknown function (DUF1488)